MRRALLLLHSPLPPDAILRPFVRAADLLVAVDGGADLALERGIEPDVVVGDLDGIRPATLRRFPKSRVHRDPDPHTSDLDKAIALVLRRGYDDVTAAGASAGRLDHTLANLAVLAKYQGRARLRLVDENFTTERVESRLSFRARRGTIVSLVSLGGARGVTTRGLRWPLHGEDLAFSSRGIHNEVARNPVTVQVERGDLWLLRGHAVRPHV